MFKIVGQGAFGKGLASYISMSANKNGALNYENIISDTEYEWIILAVPSYALTSIEIERNKKYILVSKGMVKIDEDKSFLVTEWAEELGLEHVYLAGPHLANEIQNFHPSASTIATTTEDYFYQLEQYFPSPIHTKNTHLAALGGVIKNIVAYGCGMYYAIEPSDNFNSCIITAGIQEFVNVAKELGIKFNFEELISPAIIADMILTCGSKRSRNFISGQNHINGIPSKHLTESEHSSVALIRRIGYSQNKWPILSIVSSMIDGQLCNKGDLMEAWKESINNLQVNQKTKS